MIESLSDSTIYMAYYTIAHYLQGEDNLNGDVSKSPGGIKPEDLTDDVFNFIFRKSPMPKTNISADVMEKCRKEFRYWYPMDLRVSAKDLIPNHLTMALYNHAAIWDDEPDLWPRGYYCNGHVLVDGEKMSKSKGNFLMMEDTVQKYSADATRFACADAGDSLDDANFSRTTADAAIMSLCNEEAWMVETIKSELRTGELNFMDKVLINATNESIQVTAKSFSSMQFREGLQNCWFEMLIARNEYRSFCQDSNIALHADVIKKWTEAITIMMCPICPHWSEKMWKQLGNCSYAVKTPWPEADEVDKLLTRQTKFLRDSLKNFRTQIGKAKKGWTKLSILVTDSFPQWKLDTLVWMQEQYDDGFPADFMKKLKTRCGSLPDKKMIKLTMQYASFTKKEVEDVGPVAMDTSLPFDQKATIEGCLPYFQAQLNVDSIDILKLDSEECNADVPSKVADNVVPGKAYIWTH